MRRRLRKDEFVPFASSDIGTTVSIEHEDCDDGPDHKPRLRITRNSSTVVVAYCHNCNAYGYYKGGRVFRSREELIDNNKVNVTYEKVVLPDDFTTELPIEAKAWLYKARLDDELIAAYNFGWSSSYNRVILPVYDECGDLVFWQGRDLTGHSKQKYFNYRGPKPSLFYSGFYSGNTVVITEDILSSIRCGKFLPSVSALGTSLKQEMLLQIAEAFDNILIFLDDDNPTVRKCQLDLKKAFDPLIKGRCIIIHSNGKDPKEHSDDELERILKEATDKL